MTLPLTPYSQRCLYHFDELIKHGYDPRKPNFKHLLAQRLRLFGLFAEITIDLTGERIEVWRGTQKKVEL